MEKTINTNIEKSELFEKAEGLRPLFSSNQDALNFYTKEIEKISIKYGVSISELIHNAEQDPTNDDYSSALSLDRKIQFLRK